MTTAQCELFVVIWNTCCEIIYKLWLQAEIISVLIIIQLFSTISLEKDLRFKIPQRINVDNRLKLSKTCVDNYSVSQNNLSTTVK